MSGVVVASLIHPLVRGQDDVAGGAAGLTYQTADVSGPRVDVEAPSNTLCATVYIRTGDGWRVALHQQTVADEATT